MPTWNLTSGADNFPTGGAGSPTFWTNTGDDIVNAFDGHDVIDGGVGVDILRGGAGADTYALDNAGDVVDETDGNANQIDRVFSSVAVNLSDVSHFIGQIEMVQLLGTGNIGVTGNTLRNYLTGNAGNNVIDGRGGADKMWGRAGNDTYIVDHLSDLVDESALNGGGGHDLVRSSVSFDLNNSNQAVGVIEDVTLTGSADINVLGNSHTNILTGNVGANQLDGGAGVDTLRGGAGVDTYILDNAGDVVDETGGNAREIDRIFSPVAVNLSDSSHFIGEIEAVQLLGSGDLDVTGNAVRNYLIGNSGSNIIDGGEGADSMWGRGGNDTYVVDNIGDLVDESIYEGRGVDLVQSSVSFSLVNTAQVRGAIENVTLTGSANINAVGDSRYNILTGNAGANQLDGGAGADTMIGMAGNDVYIIDGPSDFVDESIAGSNGIDTLLVSNVHFDLGTDIFPQAVGDVENVTLLGSFDGQVAGNSLANILIGNAGANYVSGRAGNDTLTGGDGDDTFYFNTALDAATNVDRITDMKSGIDAIELSEDIFTTLSWGTIPFSAFHVGTEAADADDRIIYNSANGELTYDSNGNAAGGSTLFAILENRPALTIHDFFVW